ncbi:MAG: phosphatidylserine decarboxylase family protein [Bacteroidetes bacterium]|nr:phosphatidylserine decarboxylase family protein [Bacteroidota bacterium]
MTIHKEGYHTIIIAFAFLLISAILLHTLLQGYMLYKYIFDGILFLIFLLIIYFFRSPRREMMLSHEYLFSPADGKVVVIEEVFEHEYFNDKRIQISIFMSPLNVHLNRYPCSGIVRYYKYHPGDYLVAWHPKSSEQNERTTVVIENYSNQFFLIRQIAGALARRIVCKAVIGKSVKQGEELGFIKFGSRVDLFLPLNAEVKVKLGQNVRGRKTVVAEIS